MTKLSWTSLIISLLLVVAPASAHHSFVAMYDRDRPITFTGQITRLEWANPHVYYYVDVTDEAGNVTNYAVEGATPADLQRQGVRRDFLKIGETVTVSGFRARDGSNHVNGREVTFSDGRNVFAGADDGGPGAND